MPILELNDLKAGYGKDKTFEGVSDVSFSLDRGDTLAVIGPNGSGKTTLFRAILGSIPHEGELKKEKNIKIGYVPQKIDLERDIPMTAEEFLKLRIHPSEDDEHSPAKVLKMVGLGEEYLSKKIGELSSGELQRILIAWAIIGHPDLLLFDEPTASVDVAGQETVYELLHKLQDEYSLTLALISHDLSVVYKYANKVLCLNKVQICFGSPLDVLTPDELQKLYGGERKLYHHLH
ncbi:metal ABC transporter ATP-binding protein [Candidatus Giovannonibacteria bacterium]|nr:metal ABC transporter ATP-binding protein [Candidatus Giovannonibacteria bacterium]